MIAIISAMTDKSMPHGLAVNYAAPFSGQLEEEAVNEAMARLPESIEELRWKWNSIEVTRVSGLVPTFEGGPLDDCVRDDVWQPSLQTPMPTVLGLPGSKGLIQKCPYGEFSKDMNFKT